MVRQHFEWVNTERTLERVPSISSNFKTDIHLHLYVFHWIQRDATFRPRIVPGRSLIDVVDEVTGNNLWNWRCFVVLLECIYFSFKFATFADVSLSSLYLKTFTCFFYFIACCEAKSKVTVAKFDVLTNSDSIYIMNQQG